MMLHIAKDPQPAALATLVERRAVGQQRWLAAGLPTGRLESWKHTSLRPMTRAMDGVVPRDVVPGDVVPSGETTDAAMPATQLDVTPLEGTVGTLVLINGRLNLALSVVPEGLSVVDLSLSTPDTVGTIAPIDRLEDALSARNLADFDRGVALLLDANVVIAGPVELRYLHDGAARATESRSLIQLAHHAELSLVERHLSPDGGVHLCNHVVEVDLAAGATLRHTQVQHQSEAAFHLAKVAVRQARDSRYEAQVAQFGAAIGRSDIEVFLAEPGASCQLDGFYHGHGAQHLDNHSAIHHLAGNTTSGEHYKGVLDDSATGIFRGNVLIYPNASGCATVQLNRNLLLSDRATVHTKPQLEIDNDDVTASHGATVGQLDDDALFYLRSRGIPTEEARRLLIFAFAGEIVAKVTLPALQQQLRDELTQRLAGL